MNIVQFSDSFLPIMDGVGNVVYQYATQFGLKGQESYVVAPQTDTGFRGGYPFELVDYIGLPLPKLKHYTVGTPVLDPHCLSRLAMLRPDIVHAHSPFIAGQAGAHFAQRHSVPLVGTFHSKYYDDFLQITGVELLADVGVKFVVDFYDKCDEVWAVSSSSAETLRGYGYRGEIAVMPNGTDIRTLEVGAADEVRQRYSLGEEPVLLFVGQMNWKKNIGCILDAAARLHADGLSFRLVFAGKGPHENEIRQKAQALGLEERIVCTGHLTDLRLLDGLYKAASLFVFPSLYDTSGLVVREAATMGTPSVVVRGSSAAECIEENVNGILCEDDPEDLARVIEAALSDTAAIAAMGERARLSIPVPWSTLVDGVLERYAALISAK